MTPAPFLFGKAPAHGDFVDRNLAAAPRAAWDGWVSAELETARDALDERFDTAHDAVPPWGFVCGPGALGEGWRAGAMAASVDEPGRRFLLVAGYEGLSQAQAAFVGRQAVAACETAIRRIILDHLDADAAIEVLAETAPSLDDLAAADALDLTPGSGGVWWSLGGLVDPIGEAGPPAGLVSATLARVADILGEAA